MDRAFSNGQITGRNRVISSVRSLQLVRSKLQIRRFSLRALPVGLALLTCCLAVSTRIADRATQQSIAVAKIRSTSGQVRYDYHVTAPQWCVDWFGPDLFASVKGVLYFEGGAYPADAQRNHRNYAAIRDLRDLEEIDVFDSHFPIDVLDGVSKLKHLTVQQNGLRDDAIDMIAGLSHLRVLKLPLNDITDAGARKLANHTNLSELDRSGNFVSEQAIADLRLALPDCRITNSWQRDERRGGMAMGAMLASLSRASVRNGQSAPHRTQNQNVSYEARISASGSRCGIPTSYGDLYGGKGGPQGGRRLCKNSRITAATWVAC